MSHFKTQQEVMKYVVDGGVVENKISDQRAGFEDGMLVLYKKGKIEPYLHNFDYPKHWIPYIEPKPKTKVWRWEKVCGFDGDLWLDQTQYLYTEEWARDKFRGYTKVPGSEREI